MLQKNWNFSLTAIVSVEPINVVPIGFCLIWTKCFAKTLGLSTIMKDPQNDWRTKGYCAEIQVGTGDRRDRMPERGQ